MTDSVAAAELAYLGACMTNTDVIERTTLIGEMFENPRYGAIFDKIRERHASGLGFTQATMSELLPDNARELWEATDLTSEVAAWAFHEDGIRLRALRRAVHAAGMRLIQTAEAPEADADVFASVLQQVHDETMAQDQRSARSMLDDATEVLAAARTRIRLLPTPFRALNEVIGGFAPGRMTVIGARPGVGKSAVSTQIAYELASHGPVVLATMEMDKGEVYQRIIAQQAEVYYGSRGLAPHDERKETEFVRTGMRDIRVIDSGTQTVQSIRAAVRDASKEQPVTGVVVDYIHLLSTPNRIENETQRINEITRSLKQLAMDLKVPVIALSQLNREGDVGRPILKHLRGSGGIEQDADVILFLYRDQSTQDHELLLDVAKNRQGANNRTIVLGWQPQFVRAVDLDY